MSIIYCIFLYIMAIRIFVRNSSRKSYFLTVSIVTAIMVLTDVLYIIEAGFINYFLYSGWQVLVAYLLALIWIFWGSFSLRKMKFNRSFKQKDEFISTAKGKTITYAIISALMICLGIVCIILYFNHQFNWITPVIVFAPFVIALFSIILLIKNMIKDSEEFVLITWISDEVNAYVKKIEAGKFNYKQIVGELAKLYFIYEIATINFTGDLKKIQFAYMLKLEELEDFNYQELGLVKDNSINPTLYVQLYKEKKNKAKILIKNNEIITIK